MVNTTTHHQPFTTAAMTSVLVLVVLCAVIQHLPHTSHAQRCPQLVPPATFRFPQTFHNNNVTSDWLVSLTHPIDRTFAKKEGSSPCSSNPYIAQYYIGASEPALCVTTPSKTTTVSATGCDYSFTQSFGTTTPTTFAISVVCDALAVTMQPPSTFVITSNAGGVALTYTGTFKSALVCSLPEVAVSPTSSSSPPHICPLSLPPALFHYQTTATSQMSWFVSMGAMTIGSAQIASSLLPPCPDFNTTGSKYIGVYSDDAQGDPESAVACVTAIPPAAVGTTSGCSYASTAYISASGSTTTSSPTLLRTFTINVVCDVTAKLGLVTWDGNNSSTSSIQSTTASLWTDSSPASNTFNGVVSLTGTFRSAEVCVPDVASTVRIEFILQNTINSSTTTSNTSSSISARDIRNTIASTFQVDSSTIVILSDDTTTSTPVANISNVTRRVTLGFASDETGVSAQSSAQSGVWNVSLGITGARIVQSGPTPPPAPPVRHDNSASGTPIIIVVIVVVCIGVMVVASVAIFVSRRGKGATSSAFGGGGGDHNTPFVTSEQDRDNDDNNADDEEAESYLFTNSTAKSANGNQHQDEEMNDQYVPPSQKQHEYPTDHRQVVVDGGSGGGIDNQISATTTTDTLLVGEVNSGGMEGGGGGTPPCTSVEGGAEDNGAEADEHVSSMAVPSFHHI